MTKALCVLILVDPCHYLCSLPWLGRNAHIQSDLEVTMRGPAQDFALGASLYLALTLNLVPLECKAFRALPRGKNPSKAERTHCEKQRTHALQNGI